MPRTWIKDDQVLDESFLSERELNEFFEAVVITGTETNTLVLQKFSEYFVGHGLFTGVSGVTVATGTSFINIGFNPGTLPAIVAGTNITVVSGSSTITINSTASGGSGLPIVGDSFISVATGTSSIRLSTDAIVAGSGTTVNSGTNSVVVHAPENFSYKTIVSGTSVEIPPNQQMIVDGLFVVETSGTLVINGELVSVDLVSSGTLQEALDDIEVVSSINGLQGDLTLAGTNIGVVSLGSTISLSAPVPNALVPGNNITIVSGSNTTAISANIPAIVSNNTSQLIVSSGVGIITLAPMVDKAITGDSFLSVITGTNTINLSADAIVAGNSQITITSGTNSVAISGLVPSAIIGGADITVVSGSNFIRITDNNRALVSNNTNTLTIISGTNTITFSPVVDKAIVGDSFVSVVTGTNTINLSSDAIISDSGNLVITSGISSLTLSPSATPTYTSITATTITGTTGQFGGTFSARVGNFDKGLTISGVSVPLSSVGISNVVEDLTPELGGNLDALTRNITNVGTLSATTITGTTGQFGGSVSSQSFSFSTQIVGPTHSGTNFQAAQRVSAQSGDFSTSLTISGLPAQPALYPQRIYFNAGSAVATNLPTALGFLFGTVTPIHKADLANFNEVRFYATQGVTGSANSRLRLNYATTYQSAATGYSQVLSIAGANGGVQLSINAANQIADSGWLPLRSVAKANGLFLAVLASGGDGAADPSFGPIYAEFR